VEKPKEVPPPSEVAAAEIPASEPPVSPSLTNILIVDNFVDLREDDEEEEEGPTFFRRKRKAVEEKSGATDFAEQEDVGAQAKRAKKGKGISCLSHIVSLCKVFPVFLMSLLLSSQLLRIPLPSRRGVLLFLNGGVDGAASLKTWSPQSSASCIPRISFSTLRQISFSTLRQRPLR
jgi:hypothetical protein